MLRLKVRLTEGAGKLIGCNDPSAKSLKDLQSEIATKLNASFPGTLYLIDDDGGGRYEVEDLCLLDDWQELLYVPDYNPNVKLSDLATTESFPIKQEAEGNNENENVEVNAKTKLKKKKKKGSSRRASFSDSEAELSEANEFEEEPSDDSSNESLDEKDDENDDENSDKDYEEEMATARKVTNKKSEKQSKTPPQIGGKYFAKYRGYYYPITVDQILENKVSVKWKYYNKCKRLVHLDDIVPWSREREITFEQLRSETIARHKQKKTFVARRGENSKKRKMQQRLEKRREQQEIQDDIWGPKLRTDDLADYSAVLEETSYRDEANHRRIYFCKTDEIVEDIAKRFGVPVEKILYDNSDHLKGLTRRAKLYSKTSLVLPMETFCGGNYKHGKVSATTHTASKGKEKVLHITTSQKACKACHRTDHQRSNNRLCPMNKKLKMESFGPLDELNEEPTKGVGASEQISYENQELAALRRDSQSENNTIRKRARPNLVSEVEEVTYPQTKIFTKHAQQEAASRGSSVDNAEQKFTSVGEETDCQDEGQIIEFEQPSVAEKAWYDCSDEKHDDGEESNPAAAPVTIGSS